MNLADFLDVCIKNTVERVLSERGFPEDVVYLETDNLGEVVEKLIILHIRTWMLEDAIQAASTDEEIAELKRKVDVCFKVKRPKYVQAVNKMVDVAICQNRSLVEDSVKLYKGI